MSSAEEIARLKLATTRKPRDMGRKRQSPPFPSKWRAIALKWATPLSVLVGIGALFLVSGPLRLHAATIGHWAELVRWLWAETNELLLRRGTIYDRNGLPLVRDVPTYDIALDHCLVAKPTALVDLLVDILGLGAEEATGLVSREDQFIWVKRRAPKVVAEEFRRAAETAGVKGLVFIESWAREYPQGPYSRDVLGIAGRGMAGLGALFDPWLRGRGPAGLRLIRGRDGAVLVYWEDPGEPGGDLHLTLDAGIQATCARELDRGRGESKAKRGMAVVMDPRTEEILALAQSPRTDPGAPDPAPLHPWAITDPFEPSSILHALVGTAALDLGAVNPDEVFPGSSPISVEGIFIKNAMDQWFSPSSSAQAIMYSINTVLVQVALRLGGEADVGVPAALRDRGTDGGGVSRGGGGYPPSVGRVDTSGSGHGLAGIWTLRDRAPARPGVLRDRRRWPAPQTPHPETGRTGSAPRRFSRGVCYHAGDTRAGG